MRNLARLFAILLSVSLVAVACGSTSSDDVSAATEAVAAETTEAAEAEETVDEVVEVEEASEPEDAGEAEEVVAAQAETADEEADTDESSSGGSSYGGGTTTDAADDATDEVVADAVVQTFTIDVWADNWMAVYVNGVLVGEDSVPITTERSFNSETFTFEASLPFTLAIEAKDYKETDSGLEYIGASNQQMGDGGIIAQVKDSSGAVVGVTDGDWRALVVHRAPLNTDCASDADPNSTCEYEISEVPADWTAIAFDDAAWPAASIWPSADVDPKIGYDDISWDNSAQFLWGTDLLVDNTVLLRTTVSG